MLSEQRRLHVTCERRVRQLNRNILTVRDVRTVRGQPPSLGADGYLDRLLKLVPLEVIGAYITCWGVLASAIKAEGNQRRLVAALGLLLAAGAAATWYYNLWVLGIKRPAQRVISVLAFIIWCFSTNSIFTISWWYEPWMAVVAVVGFGVLVRILEFSPLELSSRRD